MWLWMWLLAPDRLQVTICCWSTGIFMTPQPSLGFTSKGKISTEREGRGLVDVTGRKSGSADWLECFWKQELTLPTLPLVTTKICKIASLKAQHLQPWSTVCIFTLTGHFTVSGTLACRKTLGVKPQYFTTLSPCALTPKTSRWATWTVYSSDLLSRLMCLLCVCLSAAHQVFPQTSQELSTTQQRVPVGGTTQFESTMCKMQKYIQIKKKRGVGHQMQSTTFSDFPNWDGQSDLPTSKTKINLHVHSITTPVLQKGNI